MEVFVQLCWLFNFQIGFNRVATSPAGLESKSRLKSDLGWTQATVPPVLGLDMDLQLAGLGHVSCRTWT